MEQLDSDKEQHGLFVFQTLCKVEVRHEPCESSRTSKWTFERGQLIAADLMILAAGDDNGNNNNNTSFVRLTDHAGWIMTQRHGQALLRQVPVETADQQLWDVCVVTAAAASSAASSCCCALLRHPVDRSDLYFRDSKTDKPITYNPLRRLTCDAHVVHPTTGQHYYRVQGTAGGWIVDRRWTELGEELLLVVPDDAVQRLMPSLAAYVALGDIPIHSQLTMTNIDNEPGTGRRLIRAGDVVLVNAILKIDDNDGNGAGPHSFLHLEGSHGWVTEQQRLQEVAIETGQWTLQVIMGDDADAKGGGVPLRRQPFWTNTYSYSYNTVQTPNHNNILECDQRIQSPTTTGAYAYRVKETRDWVVTVVHPQDNNNNNNGGHHPLLQLITEPLTSRTGPDDKEEEDFDEWTPDFVRRIAAPIDGLEEVLFDKSRHVMAFVKDKTRINVHYDTKTVGTIVEVPINSNEKEMMRQNCTSKELAEIFETPLVVPTENNNGRHHHNKDDQSSQVSSADDTNAEEATEQAADRQQAELELRKSLLECDKHVQEVLERRQNLLQSLKVYDQERAQEAEELLQDGGVLESNHEDRSEPATVQEPEENEQQVKEAIPQVELDTSKLEEELPEETSLDSKTKEPSQTVQQQSELPMKELQKLDDDDNGFVHRPLKKAPVFRTQTPQQAQQANQEARQISVRDGIDELLELEQEIKTNREQQEEDQESKMHQLEKKEEAQNSSDQEPSIQESDSPPKKHGFRELENLETPAEREVEEKPAERTAVDSKANELLRTAAQQQSELPKNELQKLDDNGFVYRPLKKAPVLRTQRPQRTQQTNEESRQVDEDKGVDELRKLVLEPDTKAKREHQEKESEGYDESRQVDEDEGVDELRKLVLEPDTKAKREHQEKEPEGKMNEHEKKASTQEAVDREASVQEPDSLAKKNAFHELDLESSPRVFRPLKANPTFKKAVRQSINADIQTQDLVSEDAPNVTNHEPAEEYVQEDVILQSTSREVDPEVNLICGKCHVEFPTAGARREHCLHEHDLYSCNFCTQVFSSTYYLNEHRDAQDHW